MNLRGLGWNLQTGTRARRTLFVVFKRHKYPELDGGAIESDLERIQKTFSRSPTYNVIGLTVNAEAHNVKHRNWDGTRRVGERIRERKARGLRRKSETDTNIAREKEKDGRWSREEKGDLRLRAGTAGSTEYNTEKTLLKGKRLLCLPFQSNRIPFSPLSFSFCPRFPSFSLESLFHFMVPPISYFIFFLTNLFFLLLPPSFLNLLSSFPLRSLWLTRKTELCHSPFSLSLSLSLCFFLIALWLPLASSLLPWPLGSCFSAFRSASPTFLFPLLIGFSFTYSFSLFPLYSFPVP